MCLFDTKMLAIVMERVSITVTLYAIREVFCSNLGWNTGYPDRGKKKGEVVPVLN
jgi:hypothetical protein